jgi:hypothetical protein
MTGHPLGDTIEARLNDEKLDANLEDFVREIVYGVTPYFESLMCHTNMHRLALGSGSVTDRYILRCFVGICGLRNGNNSRD